MNPKRLWTVCRLELITTFKRPLFWIWIFLVLLLAMIVSAGVMKIHSGEDMAGGLQANITSQFANAWEMALLGAMLYPLFVAALAGMGVLRDGELRLEGLLHSTPLRPAEYVWGSFLAAMTISLVVLTVQLGLTMLYKHTMTAGAHPELAGDFNLSNYMVPALYFTLPLIIFVAGVSFAVGERTRSPMMVNMVPLALLLGSVFFLWTWSPGWLTPGWNRLLMLIEPTGFRWLNETWIKADMGAEFYNTARVVLDPAFLVSRLALVGIGLGSVFFSQRHLASTLHGRKVNRADVKRALATPHAEAVRPLVAEAKLSDLGMTSRRPGLLAGLLEVARLELHALVRHPAIWLLMFLVVLNCTFDAIYDVGPFDAPLLLTPGASAVGSLVELTFALCLLLMFYTVESLRRERRTRIDSIIYATPLRTSALILGKALASSMVGVMTLLAVFLTCAVLLLRQGTVPLDPWPYFIVYGLLLGPVIIFWSALVGLIYSLTGSRMTTYALSIVVMIITPILLVTKKLSWVWNWSLAGALKWSDLAPFELNRTPLLLNRLLVLSLAALLLMLIVRVFPRRVFDTFRIRERLRPAALLRTALILSPLIILPFVLGVTLQKGINRGPEGRKIERWAKNYWQRNHATWLNAPAPDLVFVDIELELEPERRWFATRGSFELINSGEEDLAQIPITGGPHWQNLNWTFNGEAYEPEDRQGLYLFTPTEPLAPGETCAVGFSFEGVFVEGFSKNGEDSSEFILPSGVVLTAYSPTVVPVMGYLEELGINKDNEYDAREYPDDFHDGVTPALFGPDTPFRTRVRITAPERYTMNSVGVKTGDEIIAGKRTVTWESDYPVKSWNVVGGLWDVRNGEGTTIYHHPGHTYNLDEMIEALNGARRYYSEWFHPYPWQELKLSEFPAEASYAQGFSTNITFSENMGFLTRPDPRANAAFMVTAHEAAHQWWGGLVVPGEGPGGNIVSEGMAHFSTALLFDQLRGPGQRAEFCKGIEDRYLDRRVVNSERPLVKTDGSRDGDTTVTYDKGGWVFWMLYNHLGRESTFDGLRSFVDHYTRDPDHPVLQDLVSHLRPFASDADAYDAFVEQWFFETVLPEYALQRVRCEETAAGSGQWLVQLVVRNVGTGRMPVEIAAEQGERFPGVENTDPAEPFREQRALVTLGPREAQEVRILCDFEPSRVVVDPEVKLLQRGRASAVHRF